MGPLQEAIENKIKDSLESLVALEIENESHMHSGGQGKEIIRETHFKVLIISDDFLSLSRVQRHQKIMGILSEELKPGRVHALSLRLLSQQEAHKKDFKSPQCSSRAKT